MAAWPIKYVSGSVPGKKRKVSAPPKKNYEDTRGAREFQDNWKDNRSWLTYDPEKGMTCTWCIEVGVHNQGYNKNAFITGSKNYRTSSILDHEKSANHVAASKVIESRKAAEKGESVAHKTLLSMNEAQRKRIVNMFRNIHALVKNHRPLSDFKWLNELDKVKGLDVGDTYNNHQAAACFLEYISDVEKEKLVRVFQNVKYFSLTMDGSTDDSVTEQETLFLRWCSMGKIETRFFCIGEPDSTCSEDLYKFVKERIEENGLLTHMSKLVGFGCDGASNMFGKKNGLVTLIKSDHPEIIAVHCLAHRLELAFKDTFKADKLFMKLTTLLLGLFYYYKKSAKQRKNLRRCMEVMNVSGTLPHRVSGSRWMPHMKKAIQTLFRTYPAFVSHLQNESHSNPKAEGMAKMLEDCNLMTFAAFLQEILSSLVRQSLTLQKLNITLADAKLTISSTIEVLQQFETSSCVLMHDIETKKEIAGYALTRKGPAVDMEKKCTAIKSSLVSHMESRYNDLKDEVIEATTIANMKSWPGENVPDFGVKEVQCIGKKFKTTLENQGADLTDLVGEWQMLKSLTYKRFGEKMSNTSLEDIHSNFSECEIPNILSLLDLLQSLPATSVVNETAFNQMKLLKTARRHRLNERHLNDCMMIRLQSPSIVEFDLKEAVDKWMLTPKGQRRRPNYQRKRKVTDQSLDMEANDTEIVEVDLIQELESASEIVDIEHSESESELNEDESENENESENEQSDNENEKLIRSFVYEYEMEYL